MGGKYCTNGRKMHAYISLVVKPRGKRPLGGTIRRWMDNVKIDLREFGWSRADWIGLEQDRDNWRSITNAVMKLRLP
jgi:hypothetical protein